MKRSSHNLGYYVASVVAGLLLTGSAVPATGGLERIRYNNPGLLVDLGVGLWAWPLPMDYDGDGDLDLVVSCSYVAYSGTYFFENPGGGKKMPVFKPGVRVGVGYTNIQASYVDGQVRVMIPGKEFLDLKGFDADRAVTVYSTSDVHDRGRKIRANQWKYVDYDGDEALDLIVGVGDWSDYGWDNAFDSGGRWTRGPLHGYVYLLRNTGSTTKPQYASPMHIQAGGLPIDVFGMPSPNFADFDGDGDLDIVCGEFLDRFTYFQNVGTRTKPWYAAGRFLQVGDKPLTMDLQMIVPVAIDWDGDGDADLVVGQEDGRVAFVENTGKVADGLPEFLPPRFFQQQADEVKFGALVTPWSFDWDGDGDEDLICGNTAGYIGLIDNLGGFPPKWAAPLYLEADGAIIRIQAGPNGSIQGPCEAKWGYTTLSVADWDGDGLPDIIANSIWGKVHWYRNVGTRTQPKLAAAQMVEVKWPGLAPKPAWTWWMPQGKEMATQWRTTPVAVDLDRDGLTDLVMLDQEGYLAFFQRARREGGLVLLPGKRIFSAQDVSEYDQRHTPVSQRPGPLRLNCGSAGASGRRKLCLADWDGDGKLDLLVNSLNVNFLQNVGQQDGQWWFRDMGAVDSLHLAGHSTSPTVVDWDHNGLPDLLVGAEDGYLYYLSSPFAGPASGGLKSAGAVSLAMKGGLDVRSDGFSVGTISNGQSGIEKVEFIYNQAPFPQCHASTIVETSGGLVAAWFGGTREKNPDVGIWLSRKPNGGSWSPPVEVANGVRLPQKRHPCWNPVLFQTRQGDLMLFYKVGPDPRAWWGMLMTSRDGGVSWSQPHRLPEGIWGPIKNKPVQLADGAILCPSSSEAEGWQVFMQVTANLGKTWLSIGPLNTGKEFDAIQPTILNHGAGKLQILCRSKQGRITQCWSQDNGKTWGAMTATALPNPNSGIDAVTLADGRHLLVYNHTVKGRSPLNVAVSSDGTSWQAAALLEDQPGEYSYPAVIQTSDGKVHITYTWKRQRIKHVVIDPAALVLLPLPEGSEPEHSEALPIEPRVRVEAAHAAGG